LEAPGCSIELSPGLGRRDVRKSGLEERERFRRTGEDLEEREKTSEDERRFLRNNR